MPMLEMTIALTKKFKKIQTTMEQLKKQLEEKNRQVDRLQKIGSLLSFAQGAESSDV